jgi:hypothetical protein
MESPDNLDSDFEGESPIIGIAMQFVCIGAVMALMYAMYCAIILTMP